MHEHESSYEQKAMKQVQCHLNYTENYHLDYTENKAHSLGVRKTVRVLSGRMYRHLTAKFLTPNECALFSV